MNQIDAFNAAPPRFARARRSDAGSSHQAAAKIESSGKGKEQAKRVLAALERHNNATSAELAKASGIPRDVVARRLPELEEAGLVQDSGKERSEQGHLRRKVSEIPCAVTGARCVRWRVGNPRGEGER